MYATTDVPLTSCIVLCKELLGYALAPTQELDLEAVHGKISAFKKVALGAQRGASTIHAIVRKPYWNHLLHSDYFRAYLHDHWLSDIFTPLMRPWSLPARTKALSMEMRLAEIYQYDFAGQFRDETVVRRSLADWKKLVRPLAQKAHAAPTNQERALCSYWRSVLSTDGLFSMRAIPIRDKDVGPASFEQPKRLE